MSRDSRFFRVNDFFVFTKEGIYVIIGINYNADGSGEKGI
jgi:hypothetical protein